MRKVIVFVPESYIDEIKSAMFTAGGGKLGQYDCCCFETIGKGQFRPLKGSSPFIGKVGNVEVVSEIKLEMVVQDSFIEEVIAAMKQAHPYEEVAYEVYRMEEV